MHKYSAKNGFKKIRWSRWNFNISIFKTFSIVFL